MKDSKDLPRCSQSNVPVYKLAVSQPSLQTPMNAQDNVMNPGTSNVSQENSPPGNKGTQN